MGVLDFIGEDLSLTKKGKDYWGLCPFHSEKTPSFSVSPTKEMWYCFGCGKGGDTIAWLMEYRHLSYPKAARLTGKILDAPHPQPKKDTPLLALARATLDLEEEWDSFQWRWKITSAKVSEMAHLPHHFSESYRLATLNEWLLLVDWGNSLRRLQLLLDFTYGKLIGS